MPNTPDGIKKVTAPALVEAPEGTVWDTQKFRAMMKEMAKMVVDEEKENEEKEIPPAKSPPYLWVILLMLIFGLGAVLTVLTVRQDLDFVVVSGGIFLIITTMTTSIFNIMRTNQTLLEAHEANVKSQLTLDQAKSTHKIVNSELTMWKDALMKLSEESVKVAYADGRKDGREQSEARTDLLAEKAK